MTLLLRGILQAKIFDGLAGYQAKTFQFLQPKA
jgi:hypothetical protein